MIFHEHIPREDMHWDDWRAFHKNIGYHQFVRFDTDELVYLSARPSPNLRHAFDFGVMVVATKDRYCPTLYTPDGESIPNGRLNYNGQQYLLVDDYTRRVVCLHLACGIVGSRVLPRSDPWRENIPTRFRSRAQAYFAGPKQPPQGYAVAVTKPRVYTKEQRAHARALMASCKAYWELRTPGKVPDALGCQERGDRLDKGIAIDNPIQPAILNDRMLGLSFKDLDFWERRAIMQRGLQSEYAQTFYPYLEVRP